MNFRKIKCFRSKKSNVKAHGKNKQFSLLTRIGVTAVAGVETAVREQHAVGRTSECASRRQFTTTTEHRDAPVQNEASRRLHASASIPAPLVDCLLSTPSFEDYYRHQQKKYRTRLGTEHILNII